MGKNLRGKQPSESNKLYLNFVHSYDIPQWLQCDVLLRVGAVQIVPILS